MVWMFDDANSGRTQVYHTTNGQYVGLLDACPESGNIEGILDIRYRVKSVKLPSGEYLVFGEDD